MDAISSAALDGLTTAVEFFLPDAADPSVQLIPLVTPTRVRPTGLGGFIGTNENPRGEILGRRLEARVLVTIKANDVDPLNDAVTTVTRAFLGADRATLLERGILRIGLDDVGAQPIGGPDGEPNGIVERSLTFEVLYEFLKRPEEPEDVILEIPINLSTA